MTTYTGDSNRICIPVSLRTQAEGIYARVFSYQYTGRGGLSWAEPYLVGVLALGWQINLIFQGKK